MEKSFLSECKQPSSITFLALFNFFLIGEDVEIVMRSLGLLSDSESDELQERYSSKEISSLFEEKEASLEEVKQAFDVFDENIDGFIDATELQRVLTALGFKEGYIA
ncbi:putative calcium-binding protein CML30 [Raphanus sativus]|nr:putative calcium-binding protein CML30 [Raphanus sativus]